MSLSGNWINLLDSILFDLNVFRDMHRLACRGGDGVRWGEVKFSNYHEFFHCRSVSSLRVSKCFTSFD